MQTKKKTLVTLSIGVALLSSMVTLKADKESLFTGEVGKTLISQNALKVCTKPTPKNAPLVRVSETKIENPKTEKADDTLVTVEKQTLKSNATVEPVGVSLTEETSLMQASVSKVDVSPEPIPEITDIPTVEAVEIEFNGGEACGYELQYSAPYYVCDNPLNTFMGVKEFNGHKETYYSELILPGEGLAIPGRHVAEDGTIRDGDGYICVASDLSYLPRYSVVLTSLGPAKVYDTGCSYGVIDIYVHW